MTNAITLSSWVQYSGNQKTVSWEGRVVDSVERFGWYMREVVRPRVADTNSSFDSELRGLATTKMETEFVKSLLKNVHKPLGWEIGETLAECAFRDDSGRQVIWPWNTVRDRRTPRASLPGADLVGFCRENEKVTFLFGEVKTSSDPETPPSVMSGGSDGLPWQLERNAKRLDIQRTLLQWLQARCRNEHFHELYKKAASRYLASEGKDLILAGILIRDTVPNELDLRARSIALSAKFDAPTRFDLVAWYLPLPIANWPNLVQEVEP